jgi:RimJ/RimL family protein N-acetyltransferase
MRQAFVSRLGRCCAIVRWVELLRTQRLLLRRWEEPDVPAFFDLYSREDVMRWLGPHPRRAVATADEARERLRRWHAREGELEPPLGYWAVVPRTELPQPVGTIPLLPLADASGPTGLTEVGWHLHPRHQGRGLATEAARAVLAAAAEAGIEQVLALTDLDNTASQALAARLGMRDEGITDRWFGLTSRQFRKALAGQGGGPTAGAPAPPAAGNHASDGRPTDS